MEYGGDFSKTTIGRSEDGSNISVGEIIIDGPDSFIDQWANSQDDSLFDTEPEY